VAARVITQTVKTAMIRVNPLTKILRVIKEERLKKTLRGQTLMGQNGKGSGRTAPKSKPKLVSSLQNPNPAYFAASKNSE